MAGNSLTLHLRATADGVVQGVDSAIAALQKLQASAGGASAEMAAAGAASRQAFQAMRVEQLAFVAVATQAFRGMVEAVNTGIDAYNRMMAASQGLESVAAFREVSGAEEALKGLTDAFLDTASASAALKNLLSRGYSLDQAVGTINRLKDAAAFGRQASLGFADAVVSATEGIKNENSVLVDNAGVTKNVARMWEEYAKARGLVTTQLTTAQKIEAEYAGIMQETAGQVGDLAKMSGTLAGAQAEAANSSLLLSQALGSSMAPTVELGTQIWNGLVSALRGAAEVSPAITAGVTTATGAITGLIAATTGLSFAQKVFKSLSASVTVFGLSLKTALGWVSAIGAVIGVAVGIYTAVAQASERARKQEEERVRANQQAAQADRSRLSSLDELARRYEELTDGRALTAQESEELARVEKDLERIHGITAKTTGDLVVKNQELAAAIKAAREEQAKQAQDSAAQASTDARLAAMEEYGKKVAEAQQKIISLQAQEAAWKAEVINAYGYGATTDEGWDDMTGGGLSNLRAEIHAGIEQIKADLASSNTDIFANWLTAVTLEARTKAQAMGADISDAAFEQLQTGWLNRLANLEDTSVEGITAFIDSAFGEMIAEIQFQASGMTSAVDDVTDMLAKLTRQQDTTQKKIRDVSAWNAARKAYDAAAKAGKDTTAAFGAMQKAAGSAGIELENSAESIALASTMFEGLEQSIGLAVAQAEDQLAALEAACAETQDGMVMYGDVQISTANAAAMINALRALITALKTDMAAAGIDPQTKGRGGGGGGGKGKQGPSEYEKAIKDMEHLRDTGKLTEEQALQTLNTIRQTVAMSAEDILDWEERIYQASEKVRESRIQAAYDMIQYRQAMGETDEAGALRELETLRQQFWVTMTEEERRHWNTTYRQAQQDYYDKVYQDATRLIEHQVHMGQISEVAQLHQLQSIYQSYTLTAEQRMELEEQIHSLAEKLRADRLQAAYADIDHRKAMNQLTLEEELAHLERIRAAYQLSAEERIALEERIHATTESLRQEREAALSQVGTGLQNALKKRYESMRDAELDYISQSQQAWKDWAEESTKAIQQQIKALDELAQKEDREKTDQEELRKIAKLRQDIQYEQDDYNRANLQKQLEQVIAARESRLRKQDVQDQKAALQEQAQAIRDKEQAEQEALKAQAQAIKDAYAQRMQTAALQAEAERMLMQDSQQQIIDLIRSYAPEYDALGNTFGEKLLDGFLSQVGRIEDWMGQFNAAIITAQQQMASASLRATDAFYGSRPTAQSVQVEQHNTFTVPVESPADTARRIRSANEALGMQLLRG